MTNPIIEWVKSRSTFLAVGLVVLGLLFAGLKFYWLSSDLDLANKKVDQLGGENAILQSDLNSATTELEGREKEVGRLHKEVQLIAALLSKRESERNQVKRDFAAYKETVSKMIESSNDETMVSWTYVAVPDQLNRLLKQAADCANSNGDQDSLCPTTKRTYLSLSDP